MYTYDNAGNLLKKYTFYGVANTVPAVHLLSIHPYNGSEISSTYTYSTSDWGDLLTNYNGATITYDAIGNPLKWRNASSLTWDKRALQSMTLSNGSTLSFGYNADGIRTQKYYNNNLAQTTYVHNYILDGSTILGETTSSVTAGGSGTTTLYYYYDESGISGVSYNGVNYSYIRNLQGDVISIINSNGVTVVEYKYDAWGNILSVTGSLASTLGTVNPFRYRGYYYDTETGFYYLNSRYYDPVVGRFLNRDAVLGVNADMAAYNLYVYCGDNPVLRYEVNGLAWFEIKITWDDVKNWCRDAADTLNQALLAIGIDTAATGAQILGFSQSNGGSSYHAPKDCWQRFGGYNDFYDDVFDTFTYMESRKFQFEYDGTKYMIWAWKGDYINLGAGAELGIYYGGDYHWLVDMNLSMEMHIYLYYQDQKLFDYTDDTWWITGFYPDCPDPQLSKLEASFVLYFNNEEMFYAFVDSKPMGWFFHPMYYLAVFTF